VKDPFPAVERTFQQALKRATDLESLEELRVSVLGKKGSLTIALRSIGQMSTKDRPKFGQKANELRQKMESELAGKRSSFETSAEEREIQKDSIDVTLPGRKPQAGQLHPLTHIENEIVSIFRSLGFSIAQGPDVETDYYNFEALNFPPDHPARDMQDTFFLDDGLLLRTHTSPVQIRHMEAHKPPVQIIIPGRVYRHDADVTRSPVFHQVEGLCIGPDITWAHLKGTLETFIHLLFGRKVGARFRPSFFPFTEPSAEVDMTCSCCSGKGCRVCKQSGWVEILGCGMVDPNVLEQVGKSWTDRGEENPYDPEKVSGFAFGMGIERISMVRYGIDDIRLFFENDLRFLGQFRG